MPGHVDGFFSTPKKVLRITAAGEISLISTARSASLNTWHNDASSYDWRTKLPANLAAAQVPLQLLVPAQAFVTKHGHEPGFSHGK